MAVRGLVRGALSAAVVAALCLAFLRPAQAEQKWLSCTLNARLPNGVPAGVPTAESPHTITLVFDQERGQFFEHSGGQLEQRSSRPDFSNNKINAVNEPGSPADAYLIDRMTGKISIDHCQWGQANGQVMQDCSSVDWSEFGSCEPTAPQPIAQPKF
jgi:hypothetical protein